MMTPIDTDSFWYEPAHILISWDMFKCVPSRAYWEHAHLILARSKQGTFPDTKIKQDLLYVFKMRGLSLTEYKPHLDIIFEEYQIENDGWRGQVRVSNAELTRWLLMCGS